MKFIIGKVLNVKVIEQPAKDFGKGPVVSYLHQVNVEGKIDGGDDTHKLSISKFDKSSEQIVPDGSTVKIAYSSKNGKPDAEGKTKEYHNIDKIEITKAAEASVSTQVVSKTETTVEPVKTHPVVSTGTTTKATSKDISMEVSGLLQSLINTGTYYKAIDGSLATESLEESLRIVLDIKRRVAKDYE